MSRGDINLRETLIASRPIWWLVTASPFAVGAWLAEPKLSLALIFGFIYFLLPYNLLRFGANDIFDYETDILNPRKTSSPHGPVLSKLKHPSLWRLMFLANIPIVLYLLAAGNLESGVFLIMMIYMSFAYSATGLRYKEIPFIDSLTWGFHTASPFIFGLLFFSSPNLWAPAFAGLYFWAVGFHAYTAIRDVSADNKAGVRTIAVYLGSKKTLAFTLVSYLLAVVAPVLGYGFTGLVALAAIFPSIYASFSLLSRGLGRAEQKVNSSLPKLLVYTNFVAVFALAFVGLYN